MHHDSITNTPHKRSHHDSVAQTSLFVDHARNVFIVVHVDDCVVVGSSSHLDEVAREMKQCSTMKVTLTLSLCQFRTDVCGCDVLASPWSKLEDHGMKGANRAVTPVVTSNHDDEDVDEATSEELRRASLPLRAGQTWLSPRLVWRGR